MILKPSSSKPISLSGIVSSEDTHFCKWIVNNKFILPDDYQEELEIDTTFSDIALSEETRKKNQRLLLDVERGRVLQRIKNAKIQKEEHIKVQQHLSEHLVEDVKAKLVDKEYIVDELLRLPGAMNDILAILFSKSVNYSKIYGAISASQEVSTMLVQLVNNAYFCKLMGIQQDFVKDAKTAMSRIGIPGLKIIIPLYILKPRLFPSFGFQMPMLSRKIWALCKTAAATGRYLLDYHDYRVDEKELEGICIGTFLSKSYIVIMRQFIGSLEEVRLECLENARKKNNRPLYNGLIEAEPDMSVLPGLFQTLRPSLDRMIIDRFDWSKLKKVKTGLEEQLDGVPFEKRSLHGRVAYQTEIFAKFDMLRRGNAFLKQQANPLLAAGHFSTEQIKAMTRKNLTSVDLSEYIGH